MRNLKHISQEYPRHFSPEDIYPYTESEHPIWEDLEAEEQAQLLHEYNTANPYMYFEAITEADNGEEFNDAILDLVKTIPLMNLSSVEEYSDEHYKVIMNFYNIAFKLFSEYLSDDIQKDILNNIDLDFLGFNMDQVKHVDISKLRKFYRNNPWGGRL